MNRTEVIAEIVQKAMVLSDAKLEGVYDFVNFLSDRNANKIRQQQDEIQHKNQIQHLVEIQEKVEIQVQVEIQEKTEEFPEQVKLNDEIVIDENLSNEIEISNNYKNTLDNELSARDEVQIIQIASIKENEVVESKIVDIIDNEELFNETVNIHKPFDFFQDEEVL